MPSDLINTFASAVRLLLALRMSAGMPKGSKQSARNSINTYSAEMSALSELQATLTLMIYGMSHGTSEPSIDVSDCLSAASLHEQLHQIRSLTHAPGEADAISAVFMDSVRSKLELNSYIKSVHGLCIANPVPCADVVEPFLPCPESDRLRIVSSMAAVLRREREGVHSRQHLLNDDCFALLRLCNRMPYCPLAPVDSAAVTNSSDVPKCRRLFIFDVLLRCLRDYAPGNDSINGGGMLFTGTATALINLSIDLLEHSQTYKAEEQLLGVGLMHRALNLSSSRNRPALLLDLCLLHRGMEGAVSPTVTACHAQGLLHALLSTLQFWQPAVQELALLCIYKLLSTCSDAMWTQLRKINLELLRLTAYYAPICPGLSTVKDSYCNTICPAEDVSSIMKTIAYMCTFSRRLDAVEFDVLLKALCDVDEDSATLLIAGMNQVVTPTKIILNNNT